MNRSSAKSQSLADRMREREINPLYVIVVAAVLVVVLGYLFWLRPEMQAAETRRNWATPESAEARAPGGKPVNAAHEQLLQQLRQKENRQGVSSHRRRDD